MTDTRPSITFTPELLKRLKAAHLQATEEGADQFVFDGYDFDRRYAGYLIQYLEDRFAGA